VTALATIARCAAGVLVSVVNAVFASGTLSATDAKIPAKMTRPNAISRAATLARNAPISFASSARALMTASGATRL
jgi:hypothetical protein